MDNANMESMARALLGSAQGMKVLGNLDKLKGFVATEEGRQFLSLLSGGGGDALKSAAAAASTGSKDAAAKLVQTLMSTPEGAKLAMSLVELMKQ